MGVLLLITGTLALLAAGGGTVGYFVSKAVENKVKENADAPVDDERVYGKVMTFLKDIQAKKVTFQPRNAFKQHYFDEYVVEGAKHVRMILTTGIGSYHRVGIYVGADLKNLIYFKFYQDGTIADVQYNKEFLSSGDMKQFAIELKKAMDMFTLYHQEKSETENYAKEIFENINELTADNYEKVDAIARIQTLLQKQYATSEIVTKEVKKAIKSAQLLHNITDLLDVEEKHTLSTIMEERLYGLLFHYTELNEEDKEKRYDELLSGIAHVNEKLVAILKRKRKGHDLEFEKHLKMIEK